MKRRFQIPRIVRPHQALYPPIGTNGHRFHPRVVPRIHIQPHHAALPKRRIQRALRCKPHDHHLVMQGIRIRPRRHHRLAVPIHRVKHAPVLVPIPTERPRLMRQRPARTQRVHQCRPGHIHRDFPHDRALFIQHREHRQLPVNAARIKAHAHHSDRVATRPHTVQDVVRAQEAQVLLGQRTIAPPLNPACGGRSGAVRHLEAGGGDDRPIAPRIDARCRARFALQQRRPRIHALRHLPNPRPPHPRRIVHVPNRRPARSTRRGLDGLFPPPRIPRQIGGICRHPLRRNGSAQPQQGPNERPHVSAGW